MAKLIKPINCFLVVFCSIFSTTVWSEQECKIKQYRSKIIQVYSHDSNSFTQGLLYNDGKLYESSGLYGQSALFSYSVDLPVKSNRINLERKYFAEGLALVGERLIQLTYRAQVAFIYDKTSFRLIDQFRYEGEGWGLAYDGKHLVMSNGSDVLSFLETEKYTAVKKIKVTRCGKPLPLLNELEVIDGIVYANIWRSNIVALINPVSGAVEGEIDFTHLVNKYKGDSTVDVLNGIAWDENNKRLFITGKKWPHLYEVSLIEPGL